MLQPYRRNKADIDRQIKLSIFQYYSIHGSLSLSLIWVFSLLFYTMIMTGRISCLVYEFFYKIVKVKKKKPKPPTFFADGPFEKITILVLHLYTCITLLHHCKLLNQISKLKFHAYICTRQ